MATRVLLAMAILASAASLGLAQKASNVLQPQRPPNSGLILAHDKYRLVLLGDQCQLVLYKGKYVLWQSFARHRPGCTVTLLPQGQLVLQDGDGNALDRFPPYQSAANDSVAVLRPDGKVAIYPYKLWSQPAKAEGGKLGAMLPLVRNLLFSGQSLYDNGQLRSGGFTFTMQDDCNLVLSSGWESGTAGRGKHCFVRLSHSGRLEIRNDSFEEVWDNGVNSNDGEYVLVFFMNGEVEVYGPQIYAFPEKKVADQRIEMVV